MLAFAYSCGRFISLFAGRIQPLPDTARMGGIEIMQGAEVAGAQIAADDSADF